jgi:hypothetical protein
MSGTFQGRVAYCTLQINGGAGSAAIVSQSGDFDAAPAAPIYTGAGNFLLTLAAGSGIDPLEATYIISAGEGTSAFGEPVVFATTDSTIQINYLTALGAANPSLAGIAKLHLAVFVKPAN